MVNSHALRLDPFSKLARLVHAFTSVSCTRSSARVGSPQSEFAKARKLGTAPIKRACRSSSGFVTRRPPHRGRRGGHLQALGLRAASIAAEAERNGPEPAV